MGRGVRLLLVIGALELGAPAGTTHPGSAGSAPWATLPDSANAAPRATGPGSARAAVGTMRPEGAVATPTFVRPGRSLIPVGARVRVQFPPYGPAPSFAMQYWRGGDKEVTGDVLFADLDTLILGIRGRPSPLAIPIATTSAVYMRAGKPHRFGALRGSLIGAGVGLGLALAFPFLYATDTPRVFVLGLPIGTGIVLGAAVGAAHDQATWEKMR